ncbi:MAG: SVM family protein [Pigeon pea little leaf phytoplasma]|uniref:SVM family protein n=1 Tax=Candidatus Phytoplasma fabacearum TaxID=2982628 RepID=A0ABU8ZTJ4_9MOLU|nr:SVM family protein ['Bituminaria bituminosa' little leaf phytoplasma]MDV3148944.1 SVM family protein [Pigeon pea little leaf phytoplasma]MDO7983679.1 SVM family protein ['Bituminaria bituminosa' little leaf phytoplasma]MDO8023989.1 SVM family protein ['Bituminaria bituminosa' little leaf phytoplasma]MDO8030705.1 SVM family protein ['Bituminaria bituminosa' little leaf phytoplasma]MDV3154168.1 SVM family protein [Pigeon pea little leaf phytoplasma]
MMRIKKKIHFLPLFLIIYFGLFFLININQVMAMENNNKGKKIINREPSDKEVNNFFQLLNKSKQNISKIKKTNPNLENASIKQIEEWLCSSNKQQTQNKRFKTIDLNKTPEQN